MTRPAIDLLFRPRSVVVYGASSDPEKLSGRPLDYLKRFGFAGTISAVNPHRDTVQGVHSFARIADVPGPIDLAVVVVPAESVADAIRHCADAGVGAAIVFASGFAEIGEKGTELQDALVVTAASGGMRLLGPNCLGTFAARTNAFATFSTAFDEEVLRPDSPIALVTQSGAVGTFTYTMMNSIGLGVRYFANTGNQADITAVEILIELVAEPDVDVLLGHMEDFTDYDSLQRLAQTAAEHAKALIILKAGRTPSGSRAVAAHSGSVAGVDEDFTEMLDDYGVVRVESMEAMADTALGFIGGRHPLGPRLTIVTLSGGAGALAVDEAVERDLLVEPWGDVDRHDLAVHLPYFGSTKNPIDVTGAMINDVEILKKTMSIVCANDATDSILVVLGNADKVADEIVATIVDSYASTTKPFLVSWTGGSGRPREQLLESGVPTYSDPTRAVRVLAHLLESDRRRERFLSRSPSGTVSTMTASESESPR